MPHPRILKALGMTAREWGQLPPEPSVIGVQGTSTIREDLRRKAQRVLELEDRLLDIQIRTGDKSGLHARMLSLQDELDRLRKDPAYANGIPVVHSAYVPEQNP
jgi:hypothetical protein